MWAEQDGGELANALRDALAAVGVRNAMRVADAIASYGSDAYTIPLGPILELLSELAELGEVEIFAKVYGLFASIWPVSARLVRESVPAKISSRYLATHRRLNPSKIISWAAAHPEWPDTLKATIAEPAMFTRTVEAMAAAIAESD